MNTDLELDHQTSDHFIPNVRPLATNGFEVILPDQIEVLVRDFPDPVEVKSERERLREHWFIHWFNNKLYHLRLKAGGPNVDGKPVPLSTNAHPWLLRSRMDDAIADALPLYQAIRERPFTFLARKVELLKDAAAAAQIEHPLLDKFKITPRFSLNAKIYESVDGISKIGIFVTVSMQYAIDASLLELASAGIDLGGQYATRRNVSPGERRLAGRIKSISSEEVTLFEATSDDKFTPDGLRLEGSKDNFQKCLNTLLGKRYKRLMEAVDSEQAAFKTGPAFDGVITRMGDFLRRTTIPLGQNISAKIGDRIVLENHDQTKSVYSAPPVDYVFDRTGIKSAEFAWPGLSQYGPYDRATFANKSPRLLVAFPASTQGKVGAFLSSFRDGMGAGYRGFPKGFRDVFGLVHVDFIMCPIDLSPSDHAGVEEKYRQAITTKLANTDDVHGGIIVLFDEHAFLTGLHNPYIQTKSLLLTLGIPTQEVRMSTVNQLPATLQYSLQNFSVSMYAKLNGTPWTVNHDKTINDELVIGMGFAELSGSRATQRQRFVGITTVFSGDGTYLLGNISNECAYDRYPTIVRDSMLNILREIKKRNNWQPGDTIRVIFHAHRPLKKLDICRIVFACTREIGDEQDIQMAFVTVSHDHPFYMFDYGEVGVPIKRDTAVMKGIFAPARGTIARIGRMTRLLAVNSGKLIKRQNSPLPAPLLVSLHPNSTFKDVDYVAEQVLKFTSLSWRSTLPAGTPVTIFYSERIAELLGRLREVPNWSPSALAVKLKWSRWFL